MVILFWLAALAAVSLFVLLIHRNVEIGRLATDLTRDFDRPRPIGDGSSLGELPPAVEKLRSALLQRLSDAEGQKALLLSIINGVGEGVLAIDRQRHVVLANRRLEAMFDVTGPIIGKTLTEAVRVAGVVAGFDRVLAGGEAAERLTIRSGVTERKIEMRVFPLPSEEIAAVALFIDVTKLERLEQIRRNFISDFTHEVRTPLTGLRSAVETFEGGSEFLSAEEDHQLRRIMQRQLSRLERLVEDLAELSQIESGDLNLTRTSVDLFRLVEDLCEDFNDRALQRRLRLVVRGDHAMICADPIRIQQAFSNLLDNAIKYGGSGSNVELEIEDSETSAVVRITDHGEGIPPEEIDRIFRRFYRIDKSRSHDIGGTGLGLAITKHLVLLHRGTIDVESESGKGSTFIVTLPKA